MNIRYLVLIGLIMVGLAACGNNAGNANSASGSDSGQTTVGISQAADNDYDGLIKELKQISKKLSELSPKAQGGDMTAAQQVSDLGMRSLTITTTLMEANTNGKLSQAQLDAWAQANDPNSP